jgi:hypothetical protein
MRKRLFPFLFATLIFFIYGIAWACKPLRILGPEELVAQAKYIVVAVPIKYQKKPKLPDHFGEISFQVKEVLKGDASIKEVVVEGILTDKDDFNEDTVPYGMVRPSGQFGNCFAISYKRGAPHLLFLSKQEGFDEYKIKEPSPYWAPLSPVNEQLRSLDDPWLQWVESEIKGK